MTADHLATSPRPIAQVSGQLADGSLNAWRHHVKCTIKVFASRERGIVHGLIPWLHSQLDHFSKSKCCQRLAVCIIDYMKNEGCGPPDPFWLILVTACWIGETGVFPRSHDSLMILCWMSLLPAMSLENQSKVIRELQTHRADVIANWHLVVLNKASKLIREVISEYKQCVCQMSNANNWIRIYPLLLLVWI